MIVHHVQHNQIMLSKTFRTSCISLAEKAHSFTSTV